MTQVKSQTIAVEHIRISSEWAFAEVRRKLESTVPKLDRGIFEALSSGDQRRAKDYEENGPRLSIFLEHDHGEALQIAGGKRNALQYDKPSSFFGQYGDERVTEVGRYLDAALESVLCNAAE